MNTSNVIVRLRRLDALHEHLIMTTRWYPMVVGGFWVLTIAALTKHFLLLGR